jgi:hypothetical protein
LNVQHDSSAHFKVKVTFNALFRDSLANRFAMTAFELPGKQVAQPPFEKWNNATKEKEPNAPAGHPEADPRAFVDGAGVEAVVNKVLQVFAHAHLTH